MYNRIVYLEYLFFTVWVNGPIGAG